MKLVIDAEGMVHGVYSDSLNKLNLGPMQMKRASYVEFNQLKQRWEARTSTGKLIAYHVDRDKVIKEELKIIENVLIEKLC